MNFRDIIRNQKFKRIGIILGIALIFGWGMVLFGKNDRVKQNPESFSAVGANLVQQSKDSMSADSPRKIQESRERMERRAKAAEAAGGTSVELQQMPEQQAVDARIPGADTITTEKREFTKLPIRMPEQPQPKEQVAQAPPKRERDTALESRVAQVLGQASVVTYGAPGTVQTGGYAQYIQKKMAEEKAREQADLQKSDASATSEKKEAVLPDLEVKPGEILYAVTDITCNSDQAGTPVVATILLGKFKGAKCLGDFARMDERLILKFSKMQYKGKQYSFSGYAVDPKTQAPGVASRVDTHFFERWGGLIASSFLQGFGQAISSQGSTTQVSALGGTTTWRPRLNTEEQVWTALGTVGEKAGQQFEKNFSRAPTVTLNAGTEIGILVL